MKVGEGGEEKVVKGLVANHYCIKQQQQQQNEIQKGIDLDLQ